MKLENHERKHLDILRPLLPECTVLLKSNGAFPLEKACPIALYGSGADHQNILSALENGFLTRRQLLINATRVYRMSKKLSEKECILR